MVEFTIRVAGVDDLVGIMLLQSTCRQVLDWSEGLWAQLLKESVNGGSLRQVWVAEAEGTVVGFLVQAGVAGIADLEMVVVSSSVRGGGIGRALCVQAMLWAQERGATSMELEVRASNEVALRLYGSLGFARQFVRREYYRDPVEDAVLMSAML